ncbi:collagen alpha-1(I) chain [Lagopus muta]|uniref:collagen alpha-1(I) chain n=1 Tax=Lagopus muta TaxID=64668 RepID=UPI00209F0124|nr:collagen alpha-1(I) chain [Lagopus muta]
MGIASPESLPGAAARCPGTEPQGELPAPRGLRRPALPAPPRGCGPTTAPGSPRAAGRRRALLTAAAGVASSGGSSPSRSRAGTGRPSPLPRGARRRWASPSGPARSPARRTPASPRRPGRERFAPSRGAKGQAGPVPAF